MVGFFSVEAGPSGSSEPTCRWGVKWSMTKSSSMPPRKPTAAGAHAGTGPPSAASSAGVMRLHTLAAIMTPAAKPKSALVKRSDMPWRAKRHERRPQGVPQKRHEERHEHACDHGIFHRCILSNFLDGFLTPSRNKHSVPPSIQWHQPSCVVAL